jgi:hypothetical protein
MEKIPKEFYVYTLADSRDNIIFYVGKGTGSRMTAHKSIARKDTRKSKFRVYNKIRKILLEGGDVLTEKVFKTNCQKEAYEYEMKLIKKIGRNNLTNLTDGGEGGFGHKMSEKNKQILIQIAKQPKSESHRANLSKAKTGIPLSKETAKKIGLSNTGKKHSKEWRENQSKSLRGLKRSEYTKSLLRKPKSKEQIEKMRIAPSKKTLCIETGKIFDSAICAAKYINVSDSAIRQAIKYNYCSGGFHWKYL